MNPTSGLWTLLTTTLLPQGLTVGNDPVDAFFLSAEAALAGAQSTKQMQAQVILVYPLLFKIYISHEFSCIYTSFILSINFYKFTTCISCKEIRM